MKKSETMFGSFGFFCIFAPAFINEKLLKNHATHYKKTKK